MFTCLVQLLVVGLLCVLLLQLLKHEVEFSPLVLLQLTLLVKLVVLEVLLLSSFFILVFCLHLNVFGLQCLFVNNSWLYLGIFKQVGHVDLFKTFVTSVHLRIVQSRFSVFSPVLFKIACVS